MKLKDGFALMELGGDYVAVPVGKTTEELRGIIRMNETGYVVWQALADGLDETQTTERLTKSYEVDVDTALKSVRTMIEKLRSAGLLED